MELRSVLLIGLQLTVYGTALVFLVLAFLWGVMVLLIRVDRSAPLATDTSSQEPTRSLSVREYAAVSLAVLLHKRLFPRGAAREGPLQRSPLWLSSGRAYQLRPWEPNRLIRTWHRGVSGRS